MLRFSSLLPQQNVFLLIVPVFRFSIILLSAFFLNNLLLASDALANNLQISNVSLEDRDAGANTVVVEFDISWDNSWRTTTAPNNHDAAWVFLKVCKGSACSPAANVAWVHGMIKTAGLNPADSSPGDNQDLNIHVPADRVGAFLYRKSNGSGTLTANNVRLTMDYSEAPLSATDTDNIQVKVFGIEMVYIPEGNFYIGDGNGTNESTYAFHVTDNTAVQVTSAMTGSVTVDSNMNDDIDTSPIRIDGDGGLDTNNDGTVDNPGFPTGWFGFYLMKYEITQGQYRDFLNTLTQEQQDNRVASTLSTEAAAGEYVMFGAGPTSPIYRITIKAVSNPADGMPYTFGCDLNANDVLDEYDDGEWIALNYLWWTNHLAYADWAGLRPITELEFEKAARGPLSAVYGEYAWGNTLITQAEGPVANSGQAAELASTTGNGLANYNGSGTDISGPLRAGFAAAAATNRASSGAGYYGVMNLSDNLLEGAVTVGNSTGRAFKGSHGDGLLTTTTGYEGNATNVDWPGIDATASRGVTGTAGSGQRGGSFYDASSYARISDRSYAAAGAPPVDEFLGGRLARTKGFVECGDDIWVYHDDADGVAPADASIRYGTVSTGLSGKTACWITQNLGASQQATSATDSTAASAGWYWQFNRKQGYSHDGVTLTPSWTITSINESSNWTSAQDPCTLELGDGWRLPTSTEWTNASTNGSWFDYNDTYASVLQIHVGGYLASSNGSLVLEGASYYLSSTQSTSTAGYSLYVDVADGSVSSSDKAYGFSSRCIKD